MSNNGVAKLFKQQPYSPDVTSSKDSWVHGNFDSARGDGGEFAKVLVGQSTEFFVVDGSSTGNDHAGGRVVGGDVVQQVSLGQGTDVLFRSEDGASQSSSLKGGGVQMIQDQLFLLLVDFHHFPQNDIALSFNGTFIQLGIQKNIRQDLHSAADIVLENLGKIHRLLTRCVGIPETKTKRDNKKLW